jgi:5-methylcytosine-specific restriction protein A
MPRNYWVTVARSESSDRTRQSGWKRLRRQVMDRDSGLCQIRGPRCAIDATMVDHITPVSMGGEDSEDNAQAVCGPCHDTKTARERAALRPRPSRRRGAPTHPADAADDLVTYEKVKAEKVKADGSRPLSTRSNRSGPGEGTPGGATSSREAMRG